MNLKGIFMTFSILNDSLQGLLESSNQAIISNLALLKATLERIYETGEGGFSQEEVLKDKQQILNILNSILLANDLPEKSQIILSDYYKYHQYYSDKYRDFLSTEEIESLGWNLNYQLALTNVSLFIKNISDEFYETDIIQKSEKISQEMSKLSFILRNYSKYLPQGVITLIKNCALETLDLPDLQPNRENLSEEINSSLTLIKHITRSVLYQIEHYKKEKKSTDGDLVEWLRTSPTWKGDDFEECLDYINEMRK
jgi:hypothetical protein